MSRRCLNLCSLMSIGTLVVGLLAPPAQAAESQRGKETAPDQTEGAEASERDQASEEAPVSERVVVISDGFKRWDGTRWLVETQVTLPVPFAVRSFRNLEFEAVAAQLQFVMACEKTFRKAKRRFEVDCQLEDLALRASPLRPNRPREPMDEVLQEWTQTLKGAGLQLNVSDDGRVINVDLEGMAGKGGQARDAETVRGQVVVESMRVLLRLAMAAFHMRLPPSNALREGQWVEYEPTLFQIPDMTNTMSGAYVIHQLNVYRGENVVQSKGMGTIRTGMADDDADVNYFKMSFDGVSLYSEDGVMTERVWALKGVASASSQLGELSDVGYFHSGRIRQLGEKEQVALGETHVVGVPGQPGTPARPAWVAIE